MTTVLKLTEEKLSEMTKTEYKVARFFIQSPEALIFDTLDTAAEKIGVSTATVIRFAKRLGFFGFKDFQERLRVESKSASSLPDKLKRTVENGGDNLFSRTVSGALGRIEESFASLPLDSLRKTASRLAGAGRVFTLGLRESYALAHYAYTRILSVRRGVCILNTGGEWGSEGLLSLGAGDVCLAFLFHRYTKVALDVLKALKARGVYVILVTSPPYDKVEALCDLILPVFTEIGGIKNCFAAPVCLCDYLCSAIAGELGEGALEYMKESEKLFSELDLLRD